MGKRWMPAFLRRSPAWTAARRLSAGATASAAEKTSNYCPLDSSRRDLIVPWSWSAMEGILAMVKLPEGRSDPMLALQCESLVVVVAVVIVVGIVAAAAVAAMLPNGKTRSTETQSLFFTRGASSFVPNK